MITDGFAPDRDDLSPLDARPFAQQDNDMYDDPFDYSGPPPQSSASQPSTTYSYDARSVHADRGSHSYRHDRTGDVSPEHPRERPHPSWTRPLSPPTL